MRKTIDPMGIQDTLDAMRRDREELPSPDPVNHPCHYTSGEIECIDAIKAALTSEEFTGYLKGSAFAYLWRERLKNGTQDLQKADWYLNRLIQFQERTKKASLKKETGNV